MNLDAKMRHSDPSLMQTMCVLLKIAISLLVVVVIVLVRCSRLYGISNFKSIKNYKKFWGHACLTSVFFPVFYFLFSIRTSRSLRTVPHTGSVCTGVAYRFTGTDG